MKLIASKKIRQIEEVQKFNSPKKPTIDTKVQQKETNSKQTKKTSAKKQTSQVKHITQHYTIRSKTPGKKERNDGASSTLHQQKQQQQQWWMQIRCICYARTAAPECWITGAVHRGAAKQLLLRPEPGPLRAIVRESPERVFSLVHPAKPTARLVPGANAVRR